MNRNKLIIPLLIFLFIIGCNDTELPNADNEQKKLVEHAIGKQMIVQALIAAHLVDAAEEAGLSTDEINLHLKQIADKTILDEFWITDSTGNAYLTNTGVEFKFSPDSSVQPQAYVFWDLLTGKRTSVNQQAQRREIDNEVYKYAAVSGIDNKRIVQVGYKASNVQFDTDVETAVGEQMVVQAEIAAHLVAIAEAAGMTPAQINARLKAITAMSVLNEFWISDSTGSVKYTNTDLDFNFSPEPSVQPQAYLFWDLITGEKDVVIQEARVREIDDKVFKYVAVDGVDKPRIVQVGLNASYLD